MADAEQTLSGDPTVGDDTDNGRHEERNDALHGIEDADMRSEADADQIGAHRGQISAPDGILEEIHDDEPELNTHNKLI